MDKGRIVIISGPSGVGKGTILKPILEENPDFFFSVSATTRAPRPGEVPGVSYHYITVAEFEKLLAEDALLEYNHYASGDYYGTPANPVREVLARGGTAILDVEPNGAFQILERYPQAITIFVAPPALADLRARLIHRGDTPPEKMEPRLKQAVWEIRQACRYTYLVVNDDKDACTNRVKAILAGAPEAEACRYENNTYLNILKEVI